MLLSILLNQNLEFGDKILQFLLCVLAILPALTMHEWAHGFAAYKLGDETAKYDGRLSMNPLDHLDPMGSLLLLLVGFGWAKPVPVNTRNFKKPKRDLALVSLAGPLMNFVLALVSALLFVLSVYICAENQWFNITASAVQEVFYYSMMYNIGLGVFNLIPLPPLDGSNIVMGVLPQRLAVKYAKIRYYSHYIFLAIMLLRFLPEPLDVIGDYIFWPVTQLRYLLTDAFSTLWDLVCSLMFSEEAIWLARFILLHGFGILI